MRPVARQASRRSPWQARYGSRHRYVRLTEDDGLPNGRRGRVTIYQRGQSSKSSSRQTFVLSWCSNGRRHKERVVGDKFDAVRRADEINAALDSGMISHRPKRLTAKELTARYLEHLRARADAGEISPQTRERYRSALEHLITFVQQLNRDRVRKPWIPSRDFALRFRAYLQGSMISPNGHPSTVKRPLGPNGISFILTSVRALTRWAIEEDLLPAASADSFSRARRHHSPGPALSPLPIATEEVVRLIQSADLYQLVLFSFHIFHGVRVAEPCWLMIEFFDPVAGWVNYQCIEELGHRTKGVVDKRLPMPASMVEGVRRLLNGRSGGPLLVKRRLIERATETTGPCVTLQRIVRDVQERQPSGWSQRARVAQAYLKKAGTIDGDNVRQEFRRLVRSAGVRTDVTPKALRHHFATALELADVPYYTRKYLLGHRLGDKGNRGGDVTAMYTHLDPQFVKSTYQRILAGPLASVLEAFEARLEELEDNTTNGRGACNRLRLRDCPRVPLAVDARKENP